MSDLEKAPLEQVVVDADELRRLRGAVSAGDRRADYYAKQVAGLTEENQRLLERLETSHNQMRIMRSSAVWRAGGVLRQAKRLAGVVVKNAVALARPS